MVKQRIPSWGIFSKPSHRMARECCSLCGMILLLGAFWVIIRMGSCKPMMRRLVVFLNTLQYKCYFVPDLLEEEIAGPKFACFKPLLFGYQEAETIYTHHQKTVIVDANAVVPVLKIFFFSFYYSMIYLGPAVGYPREPWHDLHCRIDGPTAYNILTNFEERWLKASKPHGLKKLKASYDDALLKIERIPDIVGMADAYCLSEDDLEAWHVQVFRSIDSNSVKGFLKDPKDATDRNLVCGKNVLIDMSIHTAYVKAIRAAQHFIYIENQYFLGSSYSWDSYRDLAYILFARANNLMPTEIALKIAKKIRANKRFAAYIVIPMWPEGVPTSIPTQRILFWQALVEVGLEHKYEPLDYLNFSCLSNREAADGDDTLGVGNTIAPNGLQALTRKSRRFMIYVYSKGMIVDNEYVILGSANINQHSMEGTRDTEIAMGAYQPHYTWANKLSSPHGQIYGYRKSLWAEHIGMLEECFKQLESLECVRQVRSFSELNWRQFATQEVTEMKGHLLKYPVEVD
ncbi:hypothetical protein L1049_006555 [Liquidambar formosana]|uniref:phospholipase D n=1 Tax=Liquidambar formosana TaxID=63359 RepID=A0AAP0WTW4_LIQFO